MNEYNDIHRLFLQSILSKRIITEVEAIELYSKISQITNIEATEDYPTFIGNINKQLDTLDFALRIAHDEYTGEPYLIFINVKQDSMTEMATSFTPTEISYIRELFDAIVNADHENFAISEMIALQLGQKLKPVKLTSKETQDLLEKLIQDKWIAQEKKGVYYLNTRALAELQDYFRDQYGDVIRECTTCLDVITMGERCTVPECPVRLHKYCADKRFNNSNNPTCPQCSSSWSRSETFGLGLPEED